MPLVFVHGVATRQSRRHLARRHPDVAIDIAFGAGLAARAETASRTGNQREALTTKDLEAFTAAVRYLEAGADNSAFDPLGSDAEFLSALAIELKPHSPKEGPAAEPMGPASDALQWLGQGLKDLVGPISNTASDVLLRVVHRRVDTAHSAEECRHRHQARRSRQTLVYLSRHGHDAADDRGRIGHQNEQRQGSLRMGWKREQCQGHDAFRTRCRARGPRERH